MRSTFSYNSDYYLRKCINIFSVLFLWKVSIWKAVVVLRNHYSKQFSKNETLSVPLFNNTLNKLILYGRTHNKSEKRRCSEYWNLETETSSNPFVLSVCRLIVCCMSIFHSYSFRGWNYRKKMTQIKRDLLKKSKNSFALFGGYV